MTTLELFSALTFFAFISCHSSTDKKKQNSLTTADTAKKVAAVAQHFDDTTTDSFVARLKDGVDKFNATINNSTIFIVTKDQLFVYENNAHNAWIADGRSAYIPPDKIVKVDTPYFKFNFSKWNFVKDKDYELTQAARRTGVDLNSLIKKVRNKDVAALKTFFNLRDAVDGAAAEEFFYDFWALINLWSDTQLSAFAKSLTATDKKEFTNLLLDNAPISNVTTYYQLYYPKTLTEIKLTE